MNITDFVVESNGRRITCSLACPASSQLAARPALLLTFASTRQSALTEEPYSLVVKSFLAAGHYAASFDLPNHGERINGFGQGIEGMCAALLAGEDPFSMFVADGRAVLDACLAQGIGSLGYVVLAGESRGAYCALRLFAEDTRFLACAGFAPVTDWRVLREFNAVGENPLVDSLAMEHWASKIAGRPLFLTIGHGDERVGTAHCIRLALSVLEAQQSTANCIRDQLHVVDAPDHTLTDDWRLAGTEFLLKLLGNANTET